MKRMIKNGVFKFINILKPFGLPNFRNKECKRILTQERWY